MANSKNKKSLFFNLHSLIKIWAPNVPKEVNGFLISQLGHFIIKPRNKTKKVDIILLELNKLPVFKWSMDRWDSLFGFYLTEYQGQDALVFNYKGKPDVIVSFSETINLFYLNRPNVCRKIYAILLFCIDLSLNKKDGLLLHGAVVKNEKHCLVLMGHRGTKKTMLLLTMLRDGWDFLSDDKFILFNSTAYLFQPTVPLRGHHFDSLPWLTEIVSDKQKIMKWSAAKRGLAYLSRRYVHKHLLPAMDKFLNPSLVISADILSPTCKIISSATPSIFIAIIMGNAFKLKNISKGDIIEKMTLIQRMSFYEFGQAEYMLHLYKKNLKYDIKNIIESNLCCNHFFVLTIPDDFDINQTYQELRKCIKQVS